MLKNKLLVYIIKFFHYLLKDPIQLFLNLKNDFQKDYLSSKKVKYKIIWVAGLPKSGTTVLEQILNNSPYVDLFTSNLRPFLFTNEYENHKIDENLLKSIPINKNTFFKTHTHFSENYISIAKKYNTKIIISIRDIRNMMISRYYHIINDEKHYQNKYLKNLTFQDGFKKSLVLKNEGEEYTPIEYYYFWCKNWTYYAKKNNILILKFEDFIQNRSEYLKKLINYIELPEFNFNEALSLLDRQSKKKQDFKKNLKAFGRKRSTFRAQKSSDWKNLLDQNTYNYFLNKLPGRIEDIL